jgi:hypothetical protein
VTVCGSVDAVSCGSLRSSRLSRQSLGLLNDAERLFGDPEVRTAFSSLAVIFLGHHDPLWSTAGLTLLGAAKTGSVTEFYAYYLVVLLPNDWSARTTSTTGGGGATGRLCSPMDGH